MKRILPLIALIALAAGAVQAEQAAPPGPYPTAILPFQELSPDVKGYGMILGELLFAELSSRPEFLLVERNDLDRALREQELSLTGIIDPAKAAQVGRLIGAKILIMGSIMDTENAIHAVARIVGTETSRVLGETVKGKPDVGMDQLASELAGKIANTLSTRAGELLPAPRSVEDRIAAIQDALGDAARPVLTIHIEERHVGRTPIDPAAETEISLMARACGFEIIPWASGATREADVVIQGEGFSEFGMRRGNLVGVKARVEVQAVDRESGRVLAVDRETALAVDLSEEIAGKQALQEAAARIAERMLPALVTR